MDITAPTISRKFTFQNICFFKKVKRRYLDKITLTVYYAHKFDKERKLDTGIFSFEILLENYSDFSSQPKNWWVYGKPKPLEDDEYALGYDYKQGFVDTFNLWQNDKDVEWKSLPLNSYMKGHYIYACLKYSGVQGKIVEKDIYQFDMKLIQEENDFYYYAGKEFFGQKGYIGWEYNSFKDCLVSIYYERGYSQDKTIVFRNVNDIYDQEVMSFFEEVKLVFAKYKFRIREE